MGTRPANELWKLLTAEEAEEVEHDQEADDYEVNHNVVIKLRDGTYWSGYYQTNANQDYHGWRDGDAEDFEEVEPYEVTTTAYRVKLRSS